MRRSDSAEQCLVSAREHRGEVARLDAPSSVADAVDDAVFVDEEPLPRRDLISAAVTRAPRNCRLVTNPCALPAIRAIFRSTVSP
jgi:hypothetical protein